MFDVPRRREQLRKFLLGQRDDPAIASEHDRPARRGALIERQDVGIAHGEIALLPEFSMSPPTIRQFSDRC